MKRPLRFIQVVPEHSPEILFLDQSGELGGAELCLMDVAEAFLPQAEVVLFQNGPFEDVLWEGNFPVSVVALPSSASSVSKTSGILEGLRALPAMVRLVRAVARKSREFDILYANTAKAMVVGSLVSFLVRKPLVYHLHDVINASHFSRFNRRLLVSLSNWRAARVICNSQATREAFVAAGGKHEKTAVVYNGFNLVDFKEAKCNPHHLKSELGSGGHPVALIAGRLAEWKGQHVFIEAVAKVDGLHGWIVGEALFTEEDRAYAASLKALVKQLNLEDRIHFLGFRNDLPALYHACDVVVHCSTAPEPFGRVIVEGMLCGKPVIATRHGGAVEIIADGKTGILVEPGDPSALAEALEIILNQPDKVAELAITGQQSAMERFALETVQQQIRQVVEEVIQVS